MTNYILKRLAQSAAAFAIIAVVVLAVAQFAVPPVDFPTRVREQNALALVLESLPATLFLAAFAAALALLIGVFLGILSAAYRATTIDAAIRVLATFARSLPNFALPLGLIWLLVLKAEWRFMFPRDGSLFQLLFAGLTLSLFHIAPVLLYVRTLALDTLQSSSAPSTRPGVIPVCHAFLKTLRRNPSLALSTYFGTASGILLVGSVIVEVTFGWPGAARLAIEAAAFYDFQLAGTVVLTFAALFITARFLLDALNGYLSSRTAGPLQESQNPLSPAPDAAVLSGLSIPAYPPHTSSTPVTPSTSPVRIFPAVLAFFLLLVVLILALAPSQIAPEDPIKQSLGDRHLRPFAWAQGPEHGPGKRVNFPSYPAWKHILGTDRLGRDVLSRVIHGLQIAIASAALSVAVAAIAGVSLGFVAGYWGGWLEAAISGLADATRSIPAAGLICLTAPAQSPTATLLTAAAVVLWATYFHHVRGQTTATRRQHFADGNRGEVLGFSRTLRRLAPTVARTIAVLAAMQAGFVILLQAGIGSLVSYLHTGAIHPPPTPSLGLMVSDGYRSIRDVDAWWEALFPFLAIVLLVFCFNLLGNWLRDRWAPTLSNRSR